MKNGVFKRSEVTVSEEIKKIAMELIRKTTPIDPLSY